MEKGFLEGSGMGMKYPNPQRLGGNNCSLVKNAGILLTSRRNAVKTIFVILVCLTFQCLALPLPVAEPKVVVIVIDGIRSHEIEGTATDDNGKIVPSASLFPNQCQRPW